MCVCVCVCANATDTTFMFHFHQHQVQVAIQTVSSSSQASNAHAILSRSPVYPGVQSHLVIGDTFTLTVSVPDKPELGEGSWGRSVYFTLPYRTISVQNDLKGIESD